MQPRERPAGVLGAADVEAAVDQDREAEARPGEDLGRAHPAHAAVGQLDEPDAGQLDSEPTRRRSSPRENERPKISGMKPSRGRRMIADGRGGRLPAGGALRRLIE